MDSLPSRMLTVYRIVRRAHGVYVAPILLTPIFATIRLNVALFMALDNVFFPSLRSTKASPIVLVGNPRTGTTFLQRFLSAEGFGSGMELFMSLYPSLIMQTILKPFMPLLEIISPAKWHSTEAHHTSLTSVETDDVAVLFRHFDGFFLFGFFLTFAEEDMSDSVDPAVRNTNARDFAWLRAVWRRSLVLHKADRNIAKLFSLAPRLPEFMEEFPDAKILYTVRDPVAVIPSTMSLVLGVLEKAFGFWNKPEEVRKQWIERMYAGLIMLFRRFHDDWTSGRIDHDRVFIVRYDRMMADFDGLMAEMCEFLEHEPTPELLKTIKDKADKQRAYKSGHKYDLAKYGLTEEKIREDCAFVYETFLPPLQETAKAL